MKRDDLFALASFLLIPVACLAGAWLFSAIDPEMAAGHADYQCSYQWLTLVRNLSMSAAFLVSALLWLLTCFFVVKAKQRSLLWTALAIFGPFGLIALSLLDDSAPAPRDRYHQLIRRLHAGLRVVYELCLFLAMWTLAYQGMVVKRDLLIEIESARTGVSTTQIIEMQNAESGMRAFGEGLEVMYLVGLFYLLWPIVFNALAQLAKFRGSQAK